MSERYIFEQKPSKFTPGELLAEIEQYQHTAYTTLQEQIGVRDEVGEAVVARGQHFLRALGLRPPPLIFCDASDPAVSARIAEFDERAAEEAALHPPTRERRLEGFYSAMTDIAFVNYVSLTPPATIVHELAHGTEMHSYLTQVTTDDNGHGLDFAPSRVGWEDMLRDRTSNSLLQEGRAEFLGGHSIDIDDPEVGGRMHPLGFYAPLARMVPSPDGSYSYFLPSQPGAIAHDLLVAHDPDMLDVTLYGCTSSEGLAHTVRTLNAISPNLYRDFSRLPDLAGEDNHGRFVWRLINELHDGDPKAPLYAYLKAKELLRAKLEAQGFPL